MMRCNEPGYVRIGILCTAGRRSLWVRWCEGGAVELCAGREGDDAYVRIAADDPLHGGLRDVLAAAEFAATCPRCGSLPTGLAPREFAGDGRDACSVCDPAVTARMEAR